MISILKINCYIIIKMGNSTLEANIEMDNIKLICSFVAKTEMYYNN